MKLRKVFKNICVILLLCIMIIPPVTSDAHPGRTDRYGGHYNRKTGEYHYHNSGHSVRSTSSSSRTTKKKAEASVKAVRPLTQQEAAREANIKLRANHFLLNEEIERVYQEERTPDVLSKLTKEQMMLIASELRDAQKENRRESQKFGSGIKDSTERSMYQDGVYKNKMLKARRAIAKKYGIQAGDISAIEAHVRTK